MRAPVLYRRLAIVALAALAMIPIAGNETGAKQEALGEAGEGLVRVAAHCFRHPLRIGMTEKQVLESDWCYPNDIEQSTNAPGVMQYWFYGYGDKRSGDHTGMILINNGVVTYFLEDRSD
jgi:hypothetical protein